MQLETHSAFSSHDCVRKLSGQRKAFMYKTINLLKQLLRISNDLKAMWRMHISRKFP